jgi:hypothetical protein
MNVSPITSWKDAAAYFTFAHSPTMIGVILTLSIVITLGVVVYTFMHENHSYIDYK